MSGIASGGSVVTTEGDVIGSDAMSVPEDPQDVVMIDTMAIERSRRITIEPQGK